jgi:hypothetical protein
MARAPRKYCSTKVPAAGARQARAGPTRRRCRRSGRASDARSAALHLRQTGRGSWSRPRRGIGPMHSNGSPFSGPRAVLVHPLSRMPACAAGQRDYGAVDHLDRPIPGAACSNRRHDLLIEPGARSSREPAPDRVPFAKALGQIAPRGTGPRDPEDPLQNPPVVDRRAACTPALRRQERREQRPGPRRR